MGLRDGVRMGWKIETVVDFLMALLYDELRTRKFCILVHVFYEISWAREDDTNVHFSLWTIRSFGA